MRINSIRIRGFRCFDNLSLEFDPHLTILVGENNTGKSATEAALRKLFTYIASGTDSIQPHDYPYGNPCPLTIEAALTLSSSEVDKALISQLITPTLEGHPEIREYFVKQGRDVVLRYNRPRSRREPNLSWGELRFSNNQMALEGTDFEKAPHYNWKHISGHFKQAKLGNSIFETQSDIPRSLGLVVIDHYRLIEEFRSRSILNQRTSATESLTGTETANALLNLKNHADTNQRSRYKKIVEAFQVLFPLFQIEAIEQEPGKGVPDIQFWHGQSNPISLSYVSAGVHQILTMLTNLIGIDEGQVLFLEHPEQHLHPHSMRFLHSLLRETTERAQIVVVTQDPHFVDPKTPNGLRRFWWTKDKGTQVFGLDPNMEKVQIEQIRTALRQLENREVVFARAVVLVEDESQQEFLSAVAATLDHNLDACGVSIIAVDGQNGYKPFLTLLNALCIPYVALRDLPWGNEKNYPQERFFTLGMELEDYLDKNNLKGLRNTVSQEVGKNKRRIAATLGSRLSKSEIPSLFDNVLKKAVELATGEPAQPAA